MPKFTVLSHVNARIMRAIGPRRMVEMKSRPKRLNVALLWLQFADNKKGWGLTPSTRRQ